MDIYVISLFFHIYHDLLFGRQGSFFLLAHLELRYGSLISEFSAIHNELNLSFFIGGPYFSVKLCLHIYNTTRFYRESGCIIILVLIYFFLLTLESMVDCWRKEPVATLAESYLLTARKKVLEV